MLAADRILTAAGRERLEADLDELKSTRRRMLAERVAAARESATTGDEADATGLVEAREEQMLNEMRIVDLERTLAVSETIQSPRLDDGVVRPGCTVTFRDEDCLDAYTLVGAAEANPRAGRISITAPVARALITREVGDQVKVKTPKGQREFEIVKISFQ